MMRESGPSPLTSAGRRNVRPELDQPTSSLLGGTHQRQHEASSDAWGRLFPGNVGMVSERPHYLQNRPGAAGK